MSARDPLTIQHFPSGKKKEKLDSSRGNHLPRCFESFYKLSFKQNPSRKLDKTEQHNFFY